MTKNIEKADKIKIEKLLEKENYSISQIVQKYNHKYKPKTIMNFILS